MFTTKAKGHLDLIVTSCGLPISESHPYLGATPDGTVYDLSNASEPFEVKCPYAHRNLTLEEACSTSAICCSLEGSVMTLRRTHMYFAQVQRLMAIGCREWCDFVVYNKQGHNVQRVSFDH